MNQESKLIVGLGNPGREYDWTRHNIGFLVLDKLASSRQAIWRLNAKYRCQFTSFQENGVEVGLCKPQTFMNKSGESVASIVAFYKLPLESMLVVADDVDLTFGTLRMRGKGSPGGHNGLKSIEQRVGSSNYPRLKMGVGRNESPTKSLAGHVLGKFNSQEKSFLDQIIDRAVDQIELWLRLGLIEAMNRYNGSAIY